MKFSGGACPWTPLGRGASGAELQRIPSTHNVRYKSPSGARKSNISYWSQTTDSHDTDKRRNESSDTEKARYRDIIISHCSFRFEFSGHLIASQLFHSELFSTYHKEFPAEMLTATVDAYQMLEKLKLQSELTVIYGRQDLYHCSGAVPPLKLFYDNNLIATFSETVTMLNIFNNNTNDLL